MRRVLVLVMVAVLAAACGKKQAAPKSPAPDPQESAQPTGDADSAAPEAAPAMRRTDPEEGGEGAKKTP